MPLAKPCIQVTDKNIEQDWPWKVQLVVVCLTDVSSFTTIGSLLFSQFITQIMWTCLSHSFTICPVDGVRDSIKCLAEIPKDYNLYLTCNHQEGDLRMENQITKAGLFLEKNTCIMLENILVINCLAISPKTIFFVTSTGTEVVCVTWVFFHALIIWRVGMMLVSFQSTVTFIDLYELLKGVHWLLQNCDVNLVWT